MVSDLKKTVTGALDIKRRLDHATSSNFYYSFVLLPAARRRAINDVYAFCRTLDDIVDQDHSDRDPCAELQAWREEVEACYAGYPDTPLGERLLDSIAEFALPKQPFLDIIDGMEMDLQWHSYQTFADLREYCYRVASAVGLICIEIFGYESPRAREYAVNLGLALQLTNILRDLKEDVARGRIYIPLEDLEQFGYSQKDLHANLYNAPFIELMKYEHRRAKYYFDRAAASLPEADRNSLFAAEIMGTIYRELLDGIAAAQYDVFRNRITVPKMRRMKIALNLWLRSKFGR
ncbi:MAG TPA: presqualene diphosphate synthase HpnD [Blastocatellia bacterium]|nr:presqualene diphosphate synthase HpnD [Blastocatellia bacterium]